MTSKEELQINEAISEVEEKLHGVAQVVFVTVNEQIQLAWSGARKSASEYYWRLVLRSSEEVLKLRSVSLPERREVFESGALKRLLERARELGVLGQAEQRQQRRERRASQHR